jgi:SAM-dependent methyltransferase
VLDVGCGSGALTAPLVERLGAAQVFGVDPDEAAGAACRARLPSVDVRVASADALPHADGRFDLVLAQLVLSLLADADAGVREMRRVARPGGVVAACVWDFGGGMTVLRTFWDAASSLDPAAASRDQATTRPFATREELEALWRRAGLGAITTGAIAAEASYHDFEDLWGPLVEPDGPPGLYYATLSADGRQALREEVRRRLGSPARRFALTARAWYVSGGA